MSEHPTAPGPTSATSPRPPQFVRRLQQELQVLNRKVEAFFAQTQGSIDMLAGKSDGNLTPLERTLKEIGGEQYFAYKSIVVRFMSTDAEGETEQDIIEINKKHVFVCTEIGAFARARSGTYSGLRGLATSAFARNALLNAAAGLADLLDHPAILPVSFEISTPDRKFQDRAQPCALLGPTGVKKLAKPYVFPGSTITVALTTDISPDYDTDVHFAMGGYVCIKG